uniref:Plastocyanin-like domain-containing protein n=1 Tax=Oryza rufipogon TaxID=4529 RepID=A0A0E0Q0M1_ORYRU
MPPPSWTAAVVGGFLFLLGLCHGPALLVDVPRHSNEIVIVEALKLDDVEPGMYMLHCLPLRLAGAEGSPVRMVPRRTDMAKGSVKERHYSVACTVVLL